MGIKISKYKGSKIRMERGRKMLVDKKRKCLERARGVSKLASMIAVIALTATKKTTGTFHDHTIYFSFKNG